MRYWMTTRSLVTSIMPKKWPSPLQDYQGPRDPLPTEFNPDGRSLKNTAGPKSSVWDQAPKPFLSGRPNFDFHSEPRHGCSPGFTLIRPGRV